MLSDDGQIRMGGVMSTTRTLNTHEADLPLMSKVVHVTPVGAGYNPPQIAQRKVSGTG